MVETSDSEANGMKFTKLKLFFKCFFIDTPQRNAKNKKRNPDYWKQGCKRGRTKNGKFFIVVNDEGVAGGPVQPNSSGTV